MISKETIDLLMKAGNDAFLKNRKEKENPYPSHSDEYRLWLRGYCNARHASALNEIYARH